VRHVGKLRTRLNERQEVRAGGPLSGRRKEAGPPKNTGPSAKNDSFLTPYCVILDHGNQEWGVKGLLAMAVRGCEREKMMGGEPEKSYERNEVGNLQKDIQVVRFLGEPEAHRVGKMV